MKKAIGDNMIPKEWGFEKGLELVKRAGFDGIELWLGDVPWFQMGTPDSEVRELRRKVENAGLVVSNVSTGLHWASPLSARDPKVRALAVRIVVREIETAVLLGTDAILLVAGLVTPEVPYNEVYQRCLEALRPLGEKAARSGVRIGCENCNAEQRFLISPREFWQFLRDGLPVALKRPSGRGRLMFLASPLGPALWAGDSEARGWLFDCLRTAGGEGA